MNKYLLLLFAFVGTFIISNAQQCENLVLNDVQMQCSDSDVTLVPSFLNASYKSTRAYTVGGEAPCPIPVYDQEGFTGIESDDDWQGPFQLGFNFCFFENQYDRIMVSDNGKVTFDLELEPEQFDPWDVEDGYALPTQNIQTNVILGPFMDNLTTGNNNPNPGNSISFGILNQTMPGQRIFGVEYNTPQFSCTTTNTRSRILLYESSNVIDVVIMEKLFVLDGAMEMQW